MNDHATPGPLDYDSTTASSPKGNWFWVPALALGIAQFPWWLFWGFRLMEWHSMKRVDLLNDSLFYLFTYAITLAALVTAAVAAFKAWHRRRFGVLFVCATVFGLSLLLSAYGFQDWYSAVYTNPGGIWGPW